MNDFKSIAWINVGKYPAPGNTASRDSRIRQQYGFWKDILFKQISAYQPEIIIFGKTFGLFLEDLKAELGDNLTGPFCTPGGSDFAYYWIDTRNNRVLVQTYHPSFRYLKGCNGICYGGMSEQLYIDSIVNAIRASKAYIIIRCYVVRSSACSFSAFVVPFCADCQGCRRQCGSSWYERLGHY